MKIAFSLTPLLLLWCMTACHAQVDTIEVSNTSTVEQADTTAKESTRTQNGYLYYMRHKTKGKLIFDPEVNEKTIDFYILQGYEVYKVKGKSQESVIKNPAFLEAVLKIVEIFLPMPRRKIASPILP